MRHRGYNVLNYIDDFLGFGMPHNAKASCEELYDVMSQLGLTISKKKLIPPTTWAVCLSVVEDTVGGTLAIPQKKLDNIKNLVQEWDKKTSCTKRQLQSLLGSLLYIHKCVRLARIFLNRMLELLRQAHGQNHIKLSIEFRRDLQWFKRFLPHYNGVSMYDHKPTTNIIELDACLTGLGGKYANWVYNLYSAFRDGQHCIDFETVWYSMERQKNTSEMR